MAIEVKSLSFIRDERRILSDVSFVVDSSLVVLGANGAGKTTLLKILAGLLTPNSGSVLIDNKSFSSRREWARLISYQPQSLPLVYPVKVKDFLRYSLYVQSCIPSDIEFSRSAKPPVFGYGSSFNEIVELLCIENLLEQDARTLSGGELKRVMLAGALLQGSKYVLFDEPTAFLDPNQEEVFIRSLIHVKKQITPLITTHSLKIIDRLDAAVIKLKNGSLYEGESLYV